MSAGKGWFHTLTGVPFYDTVSLNRAGYLKQKQNKQVFLSEQETVIKNQLKIQNDLDSQISETVQLLEQTVAYSNATQDELGRSNMERIRLEEQMRARIKNHTTRSVGNTVDSMIGLIPVFGKLYAYANLANDAVQHYNDTQALKDVQRDISSAERDFSQSRAVADRTYQSLDDIQWKLESNYSALKNAENLRNITQSDLDKM